MYRFEFGIEEEKKIDIKSLKCGNWPAARLTSRSSGKWKQFIDLETKQPINQAIPIDYKKKYVPPKRPQTRQVRINTEPSLNLYQEAVLTLAPQIVREIESSTVASTTYNQPPFEEPVYPYNSTKIKTRSLSPTDEKNIATARTAPSKRESLVETATKRKNGSQTARSSLSKTREIANEEQPKVQLFDFSSVRMPDTPRIVPKRHGDNPDKFPFRISTLYLSELGEAQEKEEKKKAATSRSISKTRTKERQRPKTSFTASLTSKSARRGSPTNELKSPVKTHERKGGLSIVGRPMTSLQ